MPRKEYKQTEEHKEKRRVLLIGRKFDETTKSKMRGIPHGPMKDIHKEKIKNTLIGRILTPEHIKSLRGRHHSILHKKNLSKSLKGNQKLIISHKGNKNHFYGKHHTAESKQRFKEKRKLWKTPCRDTTIEIKLQNYLKQLNVDFFTHQYIKEIKHGYQCDIFIPSLNLVIECDGDYWHKYPVGRDIDHVRTKELLEKGFKVLRLWEFEINEMSIEEFERRIVKQK